MNSRHLSGYMQSYEIFYVTTIFVNYVLIVLSVVKIAYICSKKSFGMHIAVAEISEAERPPLQDSFKHYAVVPQREEALTIRI